MNELTDILLRLVIIAIIKVTSTTKQHFSFYSPIKPFWFQKETWLPIDWIVTAMTFVITYFYWINNSKPKKV